MDEQVIGRISAYREDFNDKRIAKALEFSDGGKINSDKILDLILPFRPDEETILAVLLRDAYFNGKIDEDTVAKTFGFGVFHLLDGLKKLDDINYAQNDRSSQLEILRMMFFSMAKDLRVVLIALIFRLYMLTYLISEMSEDEKNLFARETLDLYVPIAARLGIYNVKVALEDLAFKYSSPSEYALIVNDMAKIEKKFPVSISSIKKQLDDFFVEKGIKADISGRIKGAYSVYKKLKKKGLTSVEDLFDIFAVRVILPPVGDEKSGYSLDHLYSALGLIHSEWRPIAKRFKDYIAIPKPNGYRSLHTVVLGLAPRDVDHPVEIQIRDLIMHQDAEYGVASHWLYKDPNVVDAEEDLSNRSNWIKGLSRINDVRDDFLKEIDLDIFSDRIFVLTPRGEVKDLPAGACPVDFAYSVHSDVGDKCFMAKVDGKVVPLDYSLKNGQVVEILTRKDAHPKLQWLSMVKSSFARNRIRAWFNSLNKDSNVREGRRILNTHLLRLGKAQLDQNYSILNGYDGEKLNLTQREALVEEVGKGSKLASEVIKKIYPYESIVVNRVVAPSVLKKDIKDVEDNSLESKVLVGGESGLPVKLAACCTPNISNMIVGYVTRGNSITIHQANCPIVDNLAGERLIFAGWKGATPAVDADRYVIAIKILDVDRVGLIRDLSTVISDLNISILGITIKQERGCLDEDYFLLELNSLDQFDVLMDKLEEVEGVVKVMKDENYGR